MTLKAILTTAEHGALVEPLQAEYKSGADGMFQLDVQAVGGMDLQDFTGLRTALETERGNSKTLAAKVTAFGDLDPVKARDAVTRLAALGDNPQGGEEAKAGYEAKLAELQNAHKTELTKSGEREQFLLGNLQSNMVQATATTIMAKEAIKGNPTLLLPHVEREARVIEDNGRFRVSVVDPASGNERVSTTGDRAGQPMNLEELLTEMRGRTDLSAAFQGPGASGPGTHPNSGPGHTGPGQHVISATDARDPAKYRAASAAATNAGQQLQITD